MQARALRLHSPSTQNVGPLACDAPPNLSSRDHRTQRRRGKRASPRPTILKSEACFSSNYGKIKLINTTQDIFPKRKSVALRRGRISIPTARYFVTLCSKDRKPDLTAPAISESILLGLRRLQTDGDFELHCATSMPDHIHLLFTLKDRLSLGQVVGKFKATTKDALQTQQLEWQQNYFDHRLREHIPMEDFARYIFLNPYRKELISCNEKWCQWILSKKYKPEFSELLLEGSFPPSEWLQEKQSASDLVQSDSISDGTQLEPT